MKGSFSITHLQGPSNGFMPERVFMILHFKKPGDPPETIPSVIAIHTRNMRDALAAADPAQLPVIVEQFFAHYPGSYPSMPSTAPIELSRAILERATVTDPMAKKLRGRRNYLTSNLNLLTRSYELQEFTKLADEMRQTTSAERMIEIILSQIEIQLQNWELLHNAGRLYRNIQSTIRYVTVTDGDGLAQLAAEVIPCTGAKWTVSIKVYG